MLFDVVLMNPPYNRNTHLKILRKVIQICETAINISPLRWLQDPLHLEKRGTLTQYKDVAQHIESVQRMKNDKEFDIGIFSDLGIYKLTKTPTSFDYNNYWKLFKTNTEISVIDKVAKNKKVKKLTDVIEYNKRDGIRVLLTYMAGNRGTLPVYKDISYTINGEVNGKDWTESKQMGGYSKPKNSALPISIKFNTTEEAKNFYDSYKKSKLLRFLCDITAQQQNIQPAWLPWLEDYTHKWTDDMLYEYFNITEEEKKEIERVCSQLY